MSPEKNRPRAKRGGIEFEEERAWVGFYRRVRRDPAIAAEVMVQLESEPEMKRRHLALYVGCKESLRLHKTRQAQHKRIGQFVRRLSHALLAWPLLGLRALVRRGGQIVLECLPETRREPGRRPGAHLVVQARHARDPLRAAARHRDDPPLQLRLCSAGQQAKD